MKYLAWLLVLPIALHAQINNKGQVAYTYQIPAEKVIIKNALLEFNDHASQFIYNRTDLVEQPGSGLAADGTDIKVNFDVADQEGAIVYRNFRERKLKVRVATVAKLFEAYTYDDVWMPIDWQIMDEYKQIGAFKCQKAVGSFRGRTYTAWFAEAIPLPYGPWKLFGLPGLILEAEDSEKMFRAEVKSIKYPCDCNIKILEPRAPEAKTLKEYVDFRDNYNEHVFRTMQSRLPRDVANKMKRVPSADKGRKFRDEKVFEWETEQN